MMWIKSIKNLIILFFTFACGICGLNGKPNRILKYNPGDEALRKSLAISKNVTHVLDQLLKGYDKRIRPNYSGNAVTVGITININNINSVSEVNMDYSLDIFFRQLWIDKRLAFDLSTFGINELVVGADMLSKIWLPDTFIANDRKAYFHRATVQNKFIRINPDGKVLYSMRMTVTAACPMNFRYFPMDHQVCDLEIESYGFRMDDIKYKWGNGINSSRTALTVSPNIELPQLKYKDYRLIERQFKLSTGLYSRLTMKLYFERSLGYYIIQIYIPSTLIVMLSWVSFWLDRTSAPARVSLGITTVLTMVTLIWSTNASLPKISYIKGIDVYLVSCFIMTFSCVIEYGFVSFIHRYVERDKRKKAKKDSSPAKRQGNENDTSKPKLIIIPNNTASDAQKTFNPEELNLMSPTKPQIPTFFNESGLYGSFKHKKAPFQIIEEQNKRTINSRETLQNSDGRLNRSGFKSVPILFEKNRKSNSNNDKSILFDSSSENIKETAQNNSQYCQYINNSNTIESRSRTQIKRISENSSSFGLNRNPKEIKEVKNYLVLEKIDTKNNAPVVYSTTFRTQKKKSDSCSDWRNRISKLNLKPSTIDNYSRVVFPIIFFTFHIIYWTYYLTISMTAWYNFDE